MTGPMKYEELRRAHAGEALTNWITGHQGLFVLCRELERSLKLMERAISADNHVATARQFQRFLSITRACAVAFKVAGNMSRNDYEKHVVVPMLGVDEAFTGLWARDHSSMLQQLRSTFAKLRGSVGSPCNSGISMRGSDAMRESRSMRRMQNSRRSEECALVFCRCAA